MSAYLRLGWLIGLCFFITHQNIWSQSTKYFNYRGNRNGGKIQVQFMLENEGRAQKLEGDVIDLNNYGSNLKLIVQFSNLEVGLNKTHSKIKNKDHKKRFYMEISGGKANGLGLQGSSVIKIAQAGRYGQPSNRLTYKIHPTTSQRNTTVALKTKIVDGPYEEESDAGIISRKLTLIPRRSDIEASSWNRIKKLWTNWQENPDPDTDEKRKITILEKCSAYLANCDQEAFQGSHKEEVLYYMTTVTDGEERRASIEKYRANYPKGIYLKEIFKVPVILAPEIPVVAGVARLDFDNKILIVNGVEGGIQPYHVRFFDYRKNKEIAVKSFRFTKENTAIDLESIEDLEDGIYTVKVMDKANEVFVETDEVFIRKPIKMHPSIKLGGVLLVLGALAFTYKKYIHF